MHTFLRPKAAIGAGRRPAKMRMVLAFGGLLTKGGAMFEKLLVSLLGRRTTWRLGRKIYFEARRDFADDMATDGEFTLIENVVAAFARRSPSETMSIWDVGANVGLWSEQALNVARTSGVKARLDAFEPVPDTHAELSRRLASVENAHVHQLALAAEAGNGRMRVVGEKAGTNALVREDHAEGDFVEVEISTGDAMAAKLGAGRIDLVKIDAEGHDLNVLRGMSGLCAAGRIGVIQFEYNHLWLFTGSSLHKVFALIADWPYDLARVTQSGLEIISEWNPELDRFISGNYALVKRDLASSLHAKRGGWDASNVHCPI